MSFVRFMVLRMGRIYPLHLFMLAVLVALELLRMTGLLGGRAAFDEAHSPVAILSNLLLLQSMGVHRMLTWNGVSWSIAAEMWAYLLFGAVLSAWPGKALTLFGGLATASLVLLLWLSDKGLDATQDYGFLRAILGFSVGMGVRAAFGAGIRIGGTVGEAATIALTLVLLVMLDKPTTTFLMLPAFALTVLAFASERGAISRMLRTRIPRFLGTVSYSIYLTHGLALLCAFEAMKRAGSLGFVFGAGTLGDEIAAPPFLGDAVVVSALGLTIAIATLTYRFIELPAREWVRARLNQDWRDTMAATSRA